MDEAQLFGLFVRLWEDVSHAEFYWELGVLGGVLALASGIGALLRRRLENPPNSSEGDFRRMGFGGLRRIATPAVAALLVYLARYVAGLVGWQHLSLLHLAVPLLVTWVLVRSVVYILRCVFSHGGFLSTFERLISLVIWVSLALEISGLSIFVIEALDDISFSFGKLKLSLWQILSGSVTIVSGLLIALWLASLIDRRLARSSSLDANVREVLGRVAKAILSLFALMVSLSMVGIDITALSVFSGALAVGLGFGLQKIASNYVSGFIILLDRSIRIGSLVAIDDVTSGTITNITTRYTVLKTLSGVELIIPNEHLVNNIVRNLSFSDTRVRLVVKLQVAYASNIEMAMSLMLNVAKAHPRVLTDPEPGVLLTDFADSGISLELGFWVADPEVGTGGVRSEISLAILKAFRENGVEIPFPQREVRILPTVSS